ncbi:hypothetical protein WN48_09526 [Eufriesea mexicana]|nr:hypothetical protein WN48_09526 [Eufriesea mexicana]
MLQATHSSELSKRMFCVKRKDKGRRKKGKKIKRKGRIVKENRRKEVKDKVQCKSTRKYKRGQCSS